MTSPRFPASPRRAFSLIEVVMAMAILSFAVVSILGTMPVGLSTLRTSMNATVQAHIVQSLLSDVHLAEAENLVSGATFAYDSEGRVVEATSPDAHYTAVLEVTPGVVLEQTTLPARTVKLVIRSVTDPREETVYSTIVAD